MRIRNIILAVVAAFIGTMASAAPASPVPFTYVQPDGSVIRLQLHGDEFFNWTTLYPTDQVVALNVDGWWRPAVLDESLRRAGQKRRQAVNQSLRRNAPRRTQGRISMTQGERHIPVFLLEFPDVPFSIEDPRTQFDALMNQPGYSADGAIGSTRDYFMDNSNGAFTPVFDIYGPVMLPENCATFYGGSTDRPELAFLHGAQLLDDQIDFSQYDYDGDGVVDTALFIYAGYAANVAGPATHIWPCYFDVQLLSMGKDYEFDGKHLGKFGCTAELDGASGATIAGIATVCHEFAHTLGLPDLYPSGPADQVNGELYEYSLMCSGNRFNRGRTPPCLTSIERIILGWMAEEDIIELPAGPVSFGSISGNVAFKGLTWTEGEYFLFECRDGSGWDSGLPGGLLVYHVDRSETCLSDGITALEHWDMTQTNNCVGHPCFYIVPAGHPSSDFYPDPDRTKYVFPGSLGISTYSPVDWSGKPTGLELSDIRFADRKVSMTISYPFGMAVKGTVTGANGHAIEGAHVIADGSRTAVSDKDGIFVLYLDQYEGETVHITISKDGYQTTGIDLPLKGQITLCRISLLTGDETDLRQYRYYDPGATLYQNGNGVTTSQMAAIRIPAEELDKNGGSLLNVSVNPHFSAEAYYIVVDDGDERILTYKLPDSAPHKFQTFDLSALGVDFSGKNDLFVGLAVDRCNTALGAEKPFFASRGTGHFYLSPFSLQHSDWEQLPGWDLELTATIVGHTTPRPQDSTTSFAEMGYNAIADPGNGSYGAGTAFQLQLELADGPSPQSVSWSFDGAPISASTPLSLPAGLHTVTALLTFPDGGTETLELFLDVK